MSDQKPCSLLTTLEQMLDEKAASGHFRRSRNVEATLKAVATRYLTALDGNYISFVITYKDDKPTLQVSQHTNDNRTYARQESECLEFDNFRTDWLSYLELWCQQHAPLKATSTLECTL